MVREEFQHVMEVGLDEFKLKGGADKLQWLSWDNAHNNGNAATMQALGGGQLRRLPLAQYAPDLHKVVEHAIHLTKRGVKLEVARNPHITDARELQELVQRVFYGISKAGIQKDIKTLPSTYMAVGLPVGYKLQLNGKEIQGTGGDYAPHSLR